MAIEEKYLLTFMKQLNNKVAEEGEKAEELIFDDPKSAIIRARTFGEFIIKDVLIRESIDYSNLTTNYERIAYLYKEGYFDRGIKQIMDTIRISGNKAVHEASYQPDVIEAIKIFKMMYNLGVWYIEIYSIDINIPEYRVPSLKNKGLNQSEIQSMINNALNDKLKQYLNLTSKEQEKVHKEKNESINIEVNEIDEKKQQEPIHKDLSEGRSYLLRELKRLQESAREAVESPDSFSKFKDYMHVKREIQKDFEDILKKTYSLNGPALILISGSVGDGKSHLLAYIKDKYPTLIENYDILNDATESYSPTKNALDTLSELLDGFSDGKIEHSKQKIILAINLGVLHNFLKHEHEGKTFYKFVEFIDKSGLFTSKVTTKYSDGPFHLIGFSDYQSFELTEDGARSSFYSGIFAKVFSKDNDNPFYLAYKEDMNRSIKGVIHENFEFLMDKNVQNEIIQLIIQGIIRNKLVISARAFYNFIADIIIPESYNELLDFEWNLFEKIDQTVPNLLFKRPDRSIILNTIAQFDPIHVRSQIIDKIIIDLNTLADWGQLIDKHVKHPIANDWLNLIANHIDVIDFSTYEIGQIFIRLTYLTNTDFSKKVIPISYKKYIEHLYYFNRANKPNVEDFYKEVIQTIFKWRGSPKSGYIYINKPNEKYRIAQELNLKPSLKHIDPIESEILTSFRQTIDLEFLAPKKDEKIHLEIDFTLYELLLNVQGGYCPNKKDEEDAIKFVEFLDQIMKFGNQYEELLIHIPVENKKYILARGLFDGYAFEKEQV